jgi:hypothetical protein
VVLTGGSLSGAKVALVIYIDSVCDRVESMGGAKGFHHREEFVLAVKTTGGVVAHIFSPFEFAGRNDLEWNMLFKSKSGSLGKMSPRETGRICNHREHVSAEHFVGGPGQKSRIDASGIRDQSSTQGTNPGVEGLALRYGRVRERHGDILIRQALLRRNWLGANLPFRIKQNLDAWKVASLDV